MRPRSGAGIPGSFVSEAEDIALVLRARQVRANLVWLVRVMGLVVGVGFCVLVGAALLTPCCMLKFTCRSMQSEAKGNLKAWYVMQHSFFAEHDRFGERAVDVGFAPRVGAKQRYRYVLTDVTGGGFTAWAFGIADDVEGDVWRITDENDLENVWSACR
jgi:hypothetical protein